MILTQSGPCGFDDVMVKNLPLYRPFVGDNHRSSADSPHKRLVMALLFSMLLLWTMSWWRHQMETFSALLAICARNSPVPGEFPSQRPVTRSFHIFFDLRLNKRLSKQSWGWWLETLSCPLWRHRNGIDCRWFETWWGSCDATIMHIGVVYDSVTVQYSTWHLYHTTTLSPLPVDYLWSSVLR